jgi:HlyD family secretion protein
MKLRTWIGLIVTLAIIGGIVAWTLVPGVSVEAVAVCKGPIAEHIDERGLTRLPRTFLITMPQAGRVETIEPAEGDRVRQGQVVARLVPLDLKLNVDEAASAVQRLEAAIRENAETNVEMTGYQQAQQFVKSMRDVVEAAVERVRAGAAKKGYAESHYERVKRLHDIAAQSAEEVERAEMERVTADVDYQQDLLVKTAMQSLELATNLLPTMIEQTIGNKKLREAILIKEKAEASARLSRMEEDRRRGEMPSPIDGVVLKRNIANERFLPAGEVLLELGRLEDMEVETDVLSVEVVRVEEGDPVLIYGPALPSGEIHGTVKQIYPAGFTKISSLGVEQQRVKVLVAFDPDDLKMLLERKRMGVGYRVRVKIITAEKEEALVVPRSSLVRNAEGNWQVYVLSGGTGEFQTVKVGLMNDRTAEIVDGLREGALVARTPSSNLEDGLRVEAVLTGPQNAEEDAVE